MEDLKELAQKYSVFFQYMDEVLSVEIKQQKIFSILGKKAIGIHENNSAGCIVFPNASEGYIFWLPSNDWADYAFDSIFFLSNFYDEKYRQKVGKVHSGFLLLWEDVKHQALESLRAMDPHREKTYTIFGHSLGAALGTLMAVTLKANMYKVKEVLTVGSPRIGNAPFARWVDGMFPVTNLVNRYDLVPSVPPMGQYRHSGKMLYMYEGLFHNGPGWKRGLFIPEILFGVKDHYWVSYKDALKKCYKIC